MKKQNKVAIALIECRNSASKYESKKQSLIEELSPQIITDKSEALGNLSSNQHEICLLRSLPEEDDPYIFYFLARRKGFEGQMIFLGDEKVDEFDFGIKRTKRQPIDFLALKSVRKGQFRDAINKILENSIMNKPSKGLINLKSIFESLSIMFYVENIGQDYHLAYLSPAFEHTGYSLEELYGGNNLFQKLMLPEDFKYMREQNKKVLENIEEETDYEYRIKTKSGEIRWWKDCGRPVFDKNGNKIRWFGVIYDITDKKNAEIALQESEKNYRDLIENAHDMIYQHDLEGNLKSVNKAIEKIAGYSVEEAMQLNIKDLIIPEHLEKAIQETQKRLTGDAVKPYEIEIFNKSENKVFLEINSRFLFKDNKPYLVEGIARDVTQRKMLSKELDRFYDLSYDILATIDFKGNIIQINPTWEKLLGHKKNEILNTSILKHIHPDDISKTKKFAKKISCGETVSFEARMLCKDRSIRWFEWGSIPVFEDRISYAVARDITDRKESEKQLEYNALHDSLTGLPNRNHFLKHLDLAIERASIESRFNFAVLFIDLDRFKVVNDSLGHLVGDKLLVEVAKNLKDCVRPSDVIARLGGDEFIIMVSLKEPSDAELVAERVQKKLSVPFQIDNYEVYTSASVGIIISDSKQRTSEEFLRDADTAMYGAKDAGKARYEIYTDEMNARNINLLQIENDLRKAVEEKEFRVFYQPIIDLRTGEVKEFEALIRWQHPKKGLVFPDQFINVAEETGLIIPIGSWVIEESCRQILEWEELLNLPLQISVNLSAKQLTHPFLVNTVERVIKELDIDPVKLKLEVTESTVMDNTEVALKTIKDLNKIGIKLSTDDFGTGYSSLSYLHLFPFERIKIDRSFIGRMDTDLKSEGIVRSIMMLGHNLEIDIVAEGIENQEQLWQLRSLGCQYGQGYLFSKPVTAGEAEKLLREGTEINFNETEMPFTFSNEMELSPINVNGTQ